VPLPEIKELALAAEKTALVDPRSSCVNARIALEAALHWMFENDRELRAPYESNLNAYLKEASFKETTPPHILASCEIVRKSGNLAAHETRPIQTNVSRYAVGELHKILFWFTRVYFDRDVTATFDPALLPTGKQNDTGRDAAQAFADQLSKNLAAAREKNAAMEKELAELRAIVAERKAAAETQADTHDYSEADTRKFYVDILLAEAEWKVGSDCVRTEYELDGIKRNATRTGTGYADYALFGDDGKPLAVIEAKRTSHDPIEGQMQAKDYADALEKKFGRRPLIYYTNGYKTYLWDDRAYPPRPVAGFMKRDEMELAIQRRETRESIKRPQVNESIVERPYQLLAIKAVCAHFEERHRRALVVMATGSGKTRTAIALVELMQKANWAKRVLYLCDRDSLIIQTKRAFAKFLPHSPAVDLRSTRTDTRARVCLSTYATMMNLIDETEGGVRPFSPSYFDLIIIDEAHRSIYQKYQALFTWFDGLILGLTATPRSEVDRNTYQMFELEDKNPTFAFELADAVAKGYLVSYEAMKVTTGFTRKGIRYADLSDREKEEYENLFSDPVSGELPDEIKPEALNKWLFNKPTVQGFIRNLMDYGIKAEGGDKLGKTIIFALSTEHAKFIVDCFDAAFPRWAGEFCVRIDYSLGKDAQTLIDKFATAGGFPMIAVSVDMLDTGIDIPEVVNLVFAKPVYSQVKFWQMIGRGTRLCKNLFGPDMDKTRFMIFDYCGNLEYFAANPAGKVTRPPEPLTSRLFRQSLALAMKLQAGGADTAEIGRRHLDFCKAFVKGLNTESFIIRGELKQVEKYRKDESWINLDDNSVAELINHLALLPTELDLGDENARRWDLLLLDTERQFIDRDDGFAKNRNSIVLTARDLQARSAIPEVKKNLALIDAICTDEYWEAISLEGLESIRMALRDLAKFIEPAAKKLVYSNLEDYVDEVTPVYQPLASGVDLGQYRKRMEKLLEENRNHLVIGKIRHLMPLDEADLAELDRLLFAGKDDEREAFLRLYGDRSRTQFEIENPTISLLIRSIVGLERADVEKKLAEFIDKSSYNPQQLAFVDKLVDMLARDGYVPVGALYEAPFDRFHDGGPEALFGPDADNLVKFIETANRLVM
jgi:type I restriction enzyme R subunit